jgi:diguanylate cyclase (GGDEF)-like protein
VPTLHEPVARLRAYELMELAQGAEHEDALAELESLEIEAEARGWSEAALLAALGRALHALVHDTDPATLPDLVDRLVARAEALGHGGLVAVTLAFRAVGAAGRADSASLLHDAGRAVTLADDDTWPALDRCTALVICGAAYNALSLWELASDLYDAASRLAPECERPLQDPAIAVNRVLVRLEWASGLFELGDGTAALAQLDLAARAADEAMSATGLPPLWRQEVDASRDVLAFARTAFRPEAKGDLEALLATARRRSDELGGAGSREMKPLLDALVVLALQRLGRRDEAAVEAYRLLPPASSSSGARTFVTWLRAHVLTGADPSPAVVAHREYGLQMARTRWTAREGTLSAALSRIAGERLGAEHARLARDVLLDPLTGLSNRRAFDDWLDREPDLGVSTALILVDLDGFKGVNDVYGHGVGDDVLRRVGGLIAAHVRAGDLALRLGGDEFAVVLSGEAATLALAWDRAHVLTEAIASADWEPSAPGLQVRGSAGVAAGIVGRGGGTTATRLYREADVELYRVKAARPERHSRVVRR